MRNPIVIQYRLSLLISILVAWSSSVQILAQMTSPRATLITNMSSMSSKDGSLQQSSAEDAASDSGGAPSDSGGLSSAPTSTVISTSGGAGDMVVYATDYSVMSTSGSSSSTTTTMLSMPQSEQPNNQSSYPGYNPFKSTSSDSEAEAVETTSPYSAPRPTAASQAAPSTASFDQSVSPATSDTPSTSAPPATIAATTAGTQPATTEASSGQQQPQCTLGDDTYQIGERWNPNLPPFGVQVCVLCECTVRQRKSCYEAKVACRRITNECPMIDSCPDGKKPVTVAGQCCKSCQSATTSNGQSSIEVSLSSSAAAAATQHQGQQMGKQSPTYESPNAQLKQQAPNTSFRIVYMDERTKDYMSLVKNLPACPARESELAAISGTNGNNNGKSAQQVETVQVGPAQLPASSNPKSSKSGGRNDLNGLDTRLAFKSLQDTAPYTAASPAGSSAAKSRYSSGMDATSGQRFDHSSDDHQHPNDVQSAAASNRNQLHHQYQHQHLHHHQTSATGYGTNGRQSLSNNSCKLGNDTFQVGDVWNPILPPFGVQVCVQCNCIFRLRKGCFETKVTCRRINRDCPTLKTCPDGNAPINVDGQCCKTCPTSLEASNTSELDLIAANTSIFQPTTMPLNGVMRNERVHREFHQLTRNLNLCHRTRDSVDIYNTSKYARRSVRSSFGPVTKNRSQ